MRFARVVLAVALAAIGVTLAWPGLEVPVAPSITWAGLLAPLGPGRAVESGFELGVPGRGSEHDLVMVATRPTGAHVEVHIIDRGQWPDILETATFGVAYETPRTTATEAEAVAVTKAVWTAVRANDPGGLGSVDGIPLTPGAPAVPVSERTFVRLRGTRGQVVGIAIACATLLFATLPSGAAWSAAWLFVLGLLVRAPRLGLPFPIDQDVQRMFTGHLPIGQILTGAGLDDRHPPLYFLVLHVAQWAGQSEAVGRAPAVLAGALLGPAVIAGAWLASRSRGPQVAMVALLATVSPELVKRSREVSEIPLFALFAIALCASYAAGISSPTRRRLAGITVSGALALYTYYLAPLVLAGAVAAGWLGRWTSRRAARAAAFGLAAGAPALLLEIRIFGRDEGAREAARLHPTLAWGQHGAVEMARLLFGTATETLGAPALVVLAVVSVVAVARRRVAVLAPLGALLATFAGIALVSPVARVQAYYLVAVLPLALLALAAGLPGSGAGRWLSAIVVGMACIAFVVPGLYGATRSPDEFMTDFARAIDERPERLVALTADYDSTLLAYDLARRHDVPMDWGRMHQGDGAIHLDGLPQILEPLVHVHSPGDDPEGHAIALLDGATAGGAVLVVERESLGLPRLHARLARCRPLAEASAARLLVCPASSDAAPR
jgi:hypothetical protein